MSAPQAAGLALWAGISWARGKRVTAALAGGSAVALISAMAWYVYATRSGKFVCTPAT